jgi:rhamnose transport system permease protein
MRHTREIAVALAIVTLWIVAAWLAPAFFSAENQRDLLMANMPVLIVALGMTLVILTGEIDISVGSLFAVLSVASGACAKSGLPLAVVAAVALVLGAAMGAINGALVAYVRIPSIVVTLASMVALRDGLRWVTQGAWVQDLPRGFQWFGGTMLASEASSVAVAAILVAVVAYGLRYLAAGRAVYATGSNADAARLAGINTRLITLSVFSIGGALTGCAALLNSVRFNQIPSNAGLGLELKVVAAVVVGGSAITGGRGTVTGTLLGVILLGSIGPALSFLGINAYWEKTIQGAIILAAVSLDGLRARPQGVPARA